ncbi:MAG: ABC transporter ATP-binding protein [Anaerolineae bacterium]|nr:ABC transporter ATP-binding protein [Anaerolineae bacterium]
MIPAVEFHNVTRSYGRNTIIDSLNLKIEANRFAVIFGAPACGKSTLLRLLTGLDKPDSGEIVLRGKDVTHVASGNRNIGYVPQSFALYPHYSVADNIAYPLTLLGYSKHDTKPVVERTAEQLKITHLLQKKPDQCSGGEKQRVAIARGIVKNTDIFVLDDPLTGLDFKLREQLFDDLREMQSSLNATFIYTTSDATEALMLAEEVHILDQGKIVEAGLLEDVYAHPAHVRTMELLGFPEANVFHGTLKGDGQCETALFTFSASLDANVAGGTPVHVTVRPQDIKINPPADPSLIRCPVEITLVEDLGGELVIYLEANNISLKSVVRHDEVDELTEGKAEIGIHPASLAIYAAAGGHTIGRGAA